MGCGLQGSFWEMMEPELDLKREIKERKEKENDIFPLKKWQRNKALR